MQQPLRRVRLGRNGDSPVIAFACDELRDYLNRMDPNLDEDMLATDRALT